MTKEKQENFYYATGRRKQSIARVWLKEGDGSDFTVNGASLERYFGRETSRMIVNQPFELTELVGKFNLRATVVGGGLTGQAGAIRLGIARALIQFNDALRSALRKSGFLTRDPREKERKKFGRRGARRSFQYTKR